MDCKGLLTGSACRGQNPFRQLGRASEHAKPEATKQRTKGPSWQPGRLPSLSNNETQTQGIGWVGNSGSRLEPKWQRRIRSRSSRIRPLAPARKNTQDR